MATDILVGLRLWVLIPNPLPSYGQEGTELQGPASEGSHPSSVLERGCERTKGEGNGLCLEGIGTSFPKGHWSRMTTSKHEVMDKDPGWTPPSSSSMLPGLHHHRPARAPASGASPGRAPRETPMKRCAKLQSKRHKGLCTGIHGLEDAKKTLCLCLNLPRALETRASTSSACKEKR